MEMHPVDFMAIIEPPTPRETIEVILVCCARSAELTREIRPPGPRPSLTATIGFEEVVDPDFTVTSSVKIRSIQRLADRIRVHIKVEEGGFLGIGGHGAKFKGLYRVFWQE
jgi:hypothetical protein